MGAGGAADDGDVGVEGAEVVVGAGVSVVEDAPGVEDPSSSVGFSAFSLSSSAVIGFSGFSGSQGLPYEILIEGAGFDRVCFLA
jgi:hypothetical protein